MNAGRISFKRDGDRYLVYLGKERVGFVANREGRWHWTEGHMCSLVIGGPEMKRRVRA
jgi:hypothetical protein